jgi:hypothetical protein
MLNINTSLITERFTQEFSVTINTETLPIVGTVRGLFKRIPESEFKALQAEAQKATNGLLNIRKDAEDEDSERVDIGAIDAIQDRVIEQTLIGIVGLKVDGKEFTPEEGKAWAFSAHPYSFRAASSDAFFAGYRGSKAKNAKK